MAKLEERGRAWSFEADGHLFRLASEAHRIRLAHLFDPFLAIHTSPIEPLPHQITAVYGEMPPANLSASFARTTPAPARPS